jgi:hypothetical protein
MKLSTEGLHEKTWKFNFSFSVTPTLHSARIKPFMKEGIDWIRVVLDNDLWQAVVNKVMDTREFIHKMSDY